MKKTLFMICVMLSSLCAPSIVFAYGEDSDLGYDVPIESRQMHLLVNEARSDTKTAIENCKDEYCLEKSCYKDAKAPYFWSNTLFNAAQFHSNNMKYRDESVNQDKGIAHESPCKLVTDIAGKFPTCWGQASCACQGGKFSGSTEFATRVKYFVNHDKLSYSKLGEGISQGSNNSPTSDYQTTGTFKINDSPAFYYYTTLMIENARGATGTKNKCDDDSNNNGHRFAIIGENYNTVGIGNNCAILGDDVHCSLVLDYATIKDLGIPNNLTAGSHYKTYDTLWFKTHYYSKDTDVKKVVLSIGDQCISLKQTGGLSKKNAVYGSSSLYDIPECTPYFYESIDEAGKTSRFPSTGSLLYIPVDFTQTPHCV